ncbi:phosphotransferase [Thermoproteota archaeon]
MSDSESKEFEKQLDGGRITPGVTRIGNTVRRPEKKNSEYISQVLIYLEQKQFKYSQRYLGKDKQNRDIFAYVEGSVPPDLGYTTDLQLHSFMKIVREFHDISMDFVKSDELVLCHDDLSPCNVVFREDCPWVIIDWDGVHPDERWQDLTYILWLWINIGDHRRKRKIVSRMNTALNIYGADEKTKKDFSDKFVQRMMRVLDETDVSRPDYDRVREWVQDSIRWVENNKNIITKEIG